MEKDNTELRFRRKRPSFTQVPNVLIDDEELSNNAKMLYIIINRWIDAPDYHIYKKTLKKQMKMGSENTFDKYWKELKDSGYLVQYKLKDSRGKYYYEYELLDVPEHIEKTEEEVKEEAAPKVVESVRKEDESDEKNVNSILKYCKEINYHLKKNEILDLLKSYTKDKIIEAITKAVNFGKKIDKPFLYLKSVLKNMNEVCARPFKEPKVNKFNDFEQRKYTEQDFCNMEQRLLNKSNGDSLDNFDINNLLLGL